MKKNLLTAIPLLLMFMVNLSAWAQGSISGKVIDGQNEPVIGATVAIKGTTKGAITDLSGQYSIKNVASGAYDIVASFVGSETVTQKISVGNGDANANFTLREDALSMSEVVVTGNFDKRTKLESSVAITTLNPKGLEQRANRGTGELLASVPGTFVDNSGGEVESKIYPRGLSVGGNGNGTGFRYVSLMEDGMPVMSSLIGYSPPDVLHRADITVARFEGVRGGSASVATANAPGGMYNFISKEGGPTFGGEAKMQYGIHNNGNTISRFDLNLGGPIANGWAYNVGGFYRVDQGARNIPFNANEGGQIKANIVRNTMKGKIKIYGKILNDRNTIWRDLPVDDLVNQKAALGFNLNNGSTITQMNNVLPDGGLYTTDKTATRDWNSKNGVKVKTESIGFEFTRELSKNITLVNNARYTHSNVRYNQVTGEFVLPTAAFNPYGAVTMTNVQTGAEVYNQATGVNTLGSFLMLTAALDMKTATKDFADLLSVNIKAKNHSLTLGGYYAHSQIDVHWDGDAVIQSLQPNPVVLNITTNNPFKAATGGNPARLTISDAHGWYYVGSTSLIRMSDKATVTALFANDIWQATDKLSVDAAVRIEAVNHAGKKAYWTTPALGTLPLPASLATVNQIGIDGNYGTRYDVTTRLANGQYSNFDFTNSYVSFSVGANYKLSERSALYGRYTNGHKAPDTDFYASNYTNVPVQKGVTENIAMSEIGYKVNTKKTALSITAFMSEMSNVPYNQLVVNSVTGASFYTPTTFNSTRTTGLEIEGNVKAGKIVSLAVIGTLQNPVFTKFTLYNLNGFQDPIFIGQTYPATNPSTGLPYVFPDNRLIPSAPQGTAGTPIAAGTPSYHTLESISGNKIDNLPSVILDVTPAFQLTKNLNAYINWRYTGSRQYNKSNAITLPAYSVLNAGASYTFSKFELGVKVSNLTNSAALIQTGDLGRPGTAPVDAVKPADIAFHKAAGYPFWGRPMLPRLVMFSFSYKF